MESESGRDSSVGQDVGVWMVYSMWLRVSCGYLCCCVLWSCLGAQEFLGGCPGHLLVATTRASLTVGLRDCSDLGALHITGCFWRFVLGYDWYCYLCKFVAPCVCSLLVPRCVATVLIADRNCCRA